MKVAVVVFVIGSKYITTFESKFKKNLEFYCKKQGYELIILTDFIRKEENMDKKKFFWQRLLLADKFKEYDYVVSIDADIFINIDAPGIPFNEIPDGKVACVNERKYMGNYEWRENIQVRYGYEKTGKDWYKLSGEDKNYNDHINGGLVIYQPKYHAEFLSNLYKKHIENILNNIPPDNDGDQDILSYHVQKEGLIHWLDERWNMVWVLYRILFYPFLEHKELLKKALGNLFDLSYAVHMAGHVDWDLLMN
jgi:hypothetical protein